MIKGIFASEAGMVMDRVGEFNHKIAHILWTGDAPMMALTKGMRRKSISDISMRWWEQNFNEMRFQIVAVGPTNDGLGHLITVDDASGVVESDFHLIETTGEYVYVQAVTGNQLTVVRGFANTGRFPINLVAGTPLHMQKIATAFEEGSDSPLERANIGFMRDNYTHIFRNSWGVTGTANAVRYHTGSRYAKTKQDAIMDHNVDMERAALWGVKEVGVKNGQPFHTMDGIVNQIHTNRFIAPNAGFSRRMMNDFMEIIFERNIKNMPNERIAFCGNRVLSVINEIAFDSSDYNITVNETEFGIKVARWITPFGEVTLKTHPLMNANPFWRNELYMLHPGAIEFGWLRDTMVDENNRNGTRQGRDADVGVMTSELSCAYHGEITGGIFSNIAVAAECNKVRCVQIVNGADNPVNTLAA